MNEYANLYKIKAKKIGKIISIFIIIIAIILISVGLFLMLYAIIKMDDKLVIIIVSSIMMTLGVFDIFLSIGFMKYTKNRINSISDSEAEKRYKRIYGNIDIK